MPHLCSDKFSGSEIGQFWFSAFRLSMFAKYLVTIDIKLITEERLNKVFFIFLQICPTPLFQILYLLVTQASIQQLLMPVESLTLAAGAVGLGITVQ